MRSRSSSRAVKKIRLSVRIGEDLPGGRSVAQTTFDSGPKTTGSGPASVTPLPFGPRNRVQSEATETHANKNRETIALPGRIAKDYLISTRYNLPKQAAGCCRARHWADTTPARCRVQIRRALAQAIRPTLGPRRSCLPRNGPGGEDLLYSPPTGCLEAMVAVRCDSARFERVGPTCSRAAPRRAEIELRPGRAR